MCKAPNEMEDAFHKQQQIELDKSSISVEQVTLWKIRGDSLADVGVNTSGGSVGDSYDNALAESVIGLFKAEVIEFFGLWKSVGQVEWETLQWVVTGTTQNDFMTPRDTGRRRNGGRRL